MGRPKGSINRASGVQTRLYFTVVTSEGKIVRTVNLTLPCALHAAERFVVGESSYVAERCWWDIGEGADGAAAVRCVRLRAEA